MDNLTLAVEKDTRGGKTVPKEFFRKGGCICPPICRQIPPLQRRVRDVWSCLLRKRTVNLTPSVMSLRYQHERGRNHILEIANSIEGYSKGEDIPTITLLKNMAAYISLLRKHIHTEDFVLFPMIHEEVSEIENQALLEEFKREDEKFGDNFLEDNRQLVHQLGSMLQALEI